MKNAGTNRRTVRVSAAMIVAVSAAMFAACSSSSSSVPSTHPTNAQTTPTGATPVIPVGWHTCTNDVYGYRISYPSGWYTTDHVTKPGGVAQQRSSYSCTRFDPKPFTFTWGTTPPATELAVQINTQ